MLIKNERIATVVKGFVLIFTMLLMGYLFANSEIAPGWHDTITALSKTCRQDEVVSGIREAEEDGRVLWREYFAIASKASVECPAALAEARRVKTPVANLRL